jgi:hypothetical protein
MGRISAILAYAAAACCDPHKRMRLSDADWLGATMLGKLCGKLVASLLIGFGREQLTAQRWKQHT